jgi:hypothetical protein
VKEVQKHAFFGLDVKSILRRSIRMYFAPLVGAVNGMRAELHRYDVEETAQNPKNV